MSVISNWGVSFVGHMINNLGITFLNGEQTTGWQYVLEQIKNSTRNIKLFALVIIEETQTLNLKLVDSSLFEQTIPISLDQFETLINKIATLKLDLIVYGRENAKIIEFSDKISKALNLPSNPLDFAKCKYDKYTMHEILKLNDLKHIKQTLISPLDDYNSLVSKITQANLTYPLVVKPISSTGTNGFTICNNVTEVKNHLDKTLKALSQDFEFVAQELITGIEYYIDSFSYNGKHQISSIGVYHKEYINQTAAYRYAQLVLPNDPKFNSIKDYLFKTLEIFNFDYGFAHSEVFITNDSQVVLCEVNPRVSGVYGLMNMLSKQVLGISQASLIMDHEILDKNTPIVDTWENLENIYGRILFLFNLGKPGILNKFHEEKLKKFDEVKFIYLAKPLGSYVNTLTNLFDLVACVLLITNSHEDMEKVSTEIFEMEKDGILFEIKP